MGALTFGEVDICPSCRKKDKRRNPYGRGWQWWRKESLLSYDVVIEYLPDGWCKIQCRNCHGAGVVERQTRQT